MGSQYPILKPEAIIAVLKKQGFQIASQKGSHLKLKRYGTKTRTAIVPMHDEVAKGTLKSILEQAGIELEDFLNLL